MVAPPATSRARQSASSATTALSSVSRINCAQYGLGVAEVTEDRVRCVFGKRRDAVVPRCDRDGARTDRTTAGDVAWRVADNDHGTPIDRETEYLARPLLRYRRQLGTDLVIGSVRAQGEPAKVDSRCGQLVLRARFQVPGEQANDAMGSMHERVQQRHDAGDRLDARVR